MLHQHRSFAWMDGLQFQCLVPELVDDAAQALPDNTIDQEIRQEIRL